MSDGPTPGKGGGSDGGEGLGRSVRSMAVGTAASRLTGFLRTAVIASAIGVTGIGLSYNVANTAPNIVYELLLGGILTAVVVPLLVRAAKDDEDGGQAYAQRLLTLVVLVLGTAAVLLVLAAPLVVDLYLDPGVPDAERELAILFARFFLPQVLFYGAGAVMGAILNTRGRFGPPMWAPVLNNVVMITTGLLFLLLATTDGTAAGLTTGGTLLLGIGTTLGVVAQTVALVPSLRAAGFRLRPRFDFRNAGLGRAARLAQWTFLYVVANQLAYLVVVRLATDAFEATPDRSYASYVYAFLLWQLPHAVVAVSVITGLLPRMSRAAADGRTDDLRASLNRGLRLTAALLVPAAAAFVVLGRDVAVVVFGRGNVSPEEARFIGLLLAVFAFGLVPFSTYQLQLRAFYAMQDTRTPFLVNLWVNASLVVVDVVLYLSLPEEYKVLGLAAGHATSFAVGLAVCSVVLSRRIGGLDGAVVVRTVVRCVVAVLLPAALAAGAAALVRDAVDSPVLGSLLALAAGGALLGLGYLLLARRMRVPEVDEAAAPVLRRLRR
ncbi:MAG TPA: murein biosynthesis integral membrane protein MurJ [Mycobacteriales bacterium]|nr:murein biosynthesis integral membrane protein MurJ [Mycobacteriales bacterium]